VTASFIKELIRRATLISLDEGDEAGGSDGRLRVSAEHLDSALEILAGSRHQLTRRLLGAPDTLLD
jgi:cell division protease FtsH